MAFTTGNDINILQSADIAAVGAGAGNDRYVLDASVLTAGQAITITDTQGTNTLQLTGGLVVTNSLVSNDALQLTLSNGAVITVLGASNFSFQTGGNAISGIGGSTQTYTAFVTSSLNVAAGVPAAGATSATGGTVTVNVNGGTGTGAVVPPVVGATFTLTSGIDVVNGTDGNDTIFGDNIQMQASDNINGGAGIDTLVYTDGSAAGVTMPVAAISSVEIYNVRNVNAAGNQDTVIASNFPGGTNYNSFLSTAAVTFNGLAATQQGGVIGNGAVVNGASTFGYSSGTAATINISGGTAGTLGTGSATGAGSVTLTNTAAASLTNVTINSTGANNAVGVVALGGTATGLTINAATNLVTGGVTGFLVGGTNATITVNGAATNVNLGTIEALTVKTINASGLTAGGVTAVLNGSTTFNFTGGAGNDVVTAGAVLATGASVDAGAGTADRLVITDTTFLTTVTAPFYKNFEVLQVGGAAGSTVVADVSQLAANNVITGIRVNDLALSSVTVNGLNPTQAANVAIIAAVDGTGPITLGLTGASTGGQIDTVKAALTTTNALGAAQVSNLTGLTLAGVEKLELTGNGTVAANTGLITLTTTNSTSLDSIKLSTAGLASVTVAAGHTAQNLNIDGSASSGNLTLDGTAYPTTTTTGLSLLGGSGNDILLGGSVASARDNLVGGAGNDALLGEGGTATITNGVVSITQINTQTGPDILNGGDGNDSYGFGAFAVGVTSTTVTAILDTIVSLNLGTGALAGRIDTIVIDGTNPTTTATVYTFTSGEQGNITAAATLTAAIDLAFGSVAFETNGNTVATFTYGSDTYLVFNDQAGGTTFSNVAAAGGGGAPASSDNIIKITGVVGTLDASDIVII